MAKEASVVTVKGTKSSIDDLVSVLLLFINPFLTAIDATICNKESGSGAVTMVRPMAYFFPQSGIPSRDSRDACRVFGRRPFEEWQCFQFQAVLILTNCG